MVFESATRFPSREDELLELPPPFTAYGFSKLIGEWYCRAFYDQYGLPYTICRPFNAIGPEEEAGDEVGDAHVIPDLVKKVLGGQHPLELLGDGKQTRCFTHVRDIARGIVMAMESDKAVNEDFNLGTSDEITMLELARRIHELCAPQRPFEVKYVPGFSVRHPPPRSRRLEGQAPARLGAADHVRRRPARGGRGRARERGDVMASRPSRSSGWAGSACRSRSSSRSTRLHRAGHRHQRRARSRRCARRACPSARRAARRRCRRHLGTRFFPGADLAALRQVETIIITLGTPVDDFNNPVFLPIENLLRAALPHLHAGQLLVLRSTVAPGATEHLGRLIERSTHVPHRPRPLPRRSVRSASPRASRSPSCRKCRRSSAASTPPSSARAARLLPPGHADGHAASTRAAPSSPSCSATCTATSTSPCRTSS